jgi:chromosome segregation ATPase
MRALGLGLALALWLGAGVVRAADDAEISAWRERLDAAQAEVSNARERSAAADAAYTTMRHDKSVRGDEKAKIIAARSEATQALAAAKTHLAELQEQARVAGAPPEWVLPDPSEAPADEP